MKKNKLQKTKEAIECEETTRLKKKFLYYLSSGLRHREVLGICKIHWGVVANWKHWDKDFEEAYDHAVRARNEWRQIIKREKNYRRGVEGWYEPIYFRNKPVNEVFRFSEKDMISEMRIRFPERCASACPDYWPPPPRKYEP